MGRVAIVTGSNKGIGLSIVKGLTSKFDGDVFLTSRNEDLGRASVKDLESKGLKVKYIPCDLSAKESILKVRDFMMENYGGIDVLVNNAAIAFPKVCDAPVIRVAKETVGTNYTATKDLCDILFPILSKGARVVNVSSSAGFLANFDKEAGNGLLKKFANESLTRKELDDLRDKYIKDVEAGDQGAQGWPSNSYCVSKILLSALSRIQQKEFDETPESDKVVNYVHPGYVDTDMTSHKGPLTPDEGAVSSIYAALLPPGTDIKGKFLWKDCSIVDWVNGPTPNKEVF